jgi:2-polyprenyl-3-methyl-5-hydroxy-6-metoxy-1,4-benzoquinol methylase
LESKPLHPRLKTGLNLDGSTESIVGFYADWAEQYDRDILELQYSAVENAAKLLLTLPDSEILNFNPVDKDIKIMDAGCGTGLLASELDSRGYTCIDGFDLSAEMVEQAKKLAIYRQLYPGVDINQPVGQSWRKHYHCCICIGVFTLGHVAPEALSQLLAMTRPGGLIIVSTRTAYYESTNYQAVSDGLEASGELKLLSLTRNASYTSDSDAHYWVYAVSGH